MPPEHMTSLRRIALNLGRREPSHPISLRQKNLLCSLDENYLLTVLSRATQDAITLPGPGNGQPWGASLGSPFPLLAQEVLELLHQFLRVEVFVTQGARHLVTRRVIVLL